ncbi:MAG: aminotransferase class V-fold PLP-dependent enzyme [Arenicella sp.]
MTLTYQHLRENLIGEYQEINTPFGTKPLVYADYTASGRSLKFIENFITHNVLPHYANTHTDSSFTGRQTSALREQARTIIKQAIGVHDEHHIIFCGSGATSALDKIIGLLGLRTANTFMQNTDDSAKNDALKPIVFLGAYEHHSNELPWRESAADVVTIPLLENGSIDLDELEIQLQKFKHRPLKIGSFSAASNVTGIKTDIKSIAALLHSHGALAFADYAAGAPYLSINMQGDADKNNGLDAAFISPHKFVGGPGTSGILAVHKDLCTNPVPVVQGGGTVSYVTPETHTYIQSGVRREEAGTPGIIESIRTGLVFKVQQDIGTHNIAHQESSYIQRAIDHWAENPNVKVLGNLKAERLAIASLQFFHKDKELHYGFITALFNDLFGIQVRGGCSCAGPYGHDLLELSSEKTHKIQQRVLTGNTVFRPGWVRLNFNYFISENQFQFLLKAIDLVAEFAWKLLPYYQYNSHQGIWLYQGEKTELPVSLLNNSYLQPSKSSFVHNEPNFDALLEQAKQELCAQRNHQDKKSLPEAIEKDSFYWFYKPEELDSHTKI